MPLFTSIAILEEDGDNILKIKSQQLMSGSFLLHDIFKISSTLTTIPT